MEDILSYAIYLNITEDQILLHDSNLLYDNRDCDTEYVTQKWFQEHEANFTVLLWPPKFPHLNSISYLWDVWN